MINKLIKLSDTHYIIVDDSKKVFSGIGWNNETKTINIFVSHPKYNEEGLKITYSTQPLEPSLKSDNNTLKDYVFIKPLSLSEVEEAIYGYSTYELFKKIDGTCKKDEYEHWLFKEGFKAHQEIVKDKLFTIENMKIAIQMAKEKEKNGMITYEDKWNEDEILRELLPKTEWGVEFIEDKIKLI